MLRPLSLALAVPLALAGCSASSGGTHRKTESAACPLIAELDATVAEVTRADVKDPTTFKQTLDDAVARYVSTTDRLKKVAPPELQGDLDRIAAAVHQYRFEDASSARTALDSYAVTTCGRTPPTFAPTTTVGSDTNESTTTPSSTP